MTTVDLASVDELLTTTRSVRKRLDLTRPVGRDVILECIQLAMQAPTASNAQDWRWLVITDPDKRAAIAEIYRSHRCRVPCLRRQGRDRSANPTRVRQRVQPDRHAGTGSRACDPMPGQPHRQLQHAHRGVGVGVDHPGRLELSACAAIPRSRIGVDDNAFGQGAGGRRTAGNPETVTQAALFPVAYTIGTDFRPAARPPAETVTFWDGWGQN